MSKKSRRRNKKILGALGALGALAMLGSKKKPVSTKTTIMDNMPKNDIEFKETVVATPVSTKTTIMDSMPARPKLNEKSIRVKDGKVFTIEGAKKGIPSKRSGIDTPGIYVRDDGRITAGGKQYLNKQHYASRNEKPAMLGNNFYKKRPVEVFQDSMLGDTSIGGGVSAKKGGRIVKGKKTAVRTGAAKRGFGRAYLKGGK
jgi:hypothetical protein